MEKPTLSNHDALIHVSWTAKHFMHEAIDMIDAAPIAEYGRIKGL